MILVYGSLQFHIVFMWSLLVVVVGVGVGVGVVVVVVVVVGVVVVGVVVVVVVVGAAAAAVFDWLPHSLLIAKVHGYRVNKTSTEYLKDY